MDEIILFKTADINLASALLAAGFAVDTTDNSNPKRIYFFFEKNEQLEQAVDNYWRGELKVDAKDIGLCRRELMSRIYDEKSP